jgi:hypothetical protein
MGGSRGGCPLESRQTADSRRQTADRQTDNVQQTDRQQTADKQGADSRQAADSVRNRVVGVQHVLQRAPVEVLQGQLGGAILCVVTAMCYRVMAMMLQSNGYGVTE